MSSLWRAFRRTPVGEAVAGSPLRPRHWWASFAAARHLWFTYGHVRSVRSYSAVDVAGDPLPWYTYPAIEYLKQFDFADKSVFEYGSGNSTLFWSKVAGRVISVEDDEEWFAITQPRLPPHCTLVLEPDLNRYVDVIHQSAQDFDIIVVDGPARGQTRLKCARAALEHLRPGGLIILDNSDWLPESSRLLRDAGLLQVDMSGFVPIGGNTQTTSLFFHRACELRPKGNRQPQPSAAAIVKDWEGAPAPAGPVLEWGGQPIYGVVRQVPFEKSTPSGRRRFEFAARDRERSRDVFILDLDVDRILVGPYAIAPTDAAVDDEIARLRDLSWDSFREFVRGQSSRRYVLD